MKPIRPWFKVGDNAGDRTLSQQMQGLMLLQQSVPGKSVLDIGCAEGLIDFELIKAGAVAVHGVESRPQAVIDANALRGDMACTFEQGDANDWRPQRSYDVVLLLAVLHKLKDPCGACARFVEAARELVAIRLPADARWSSGHVVVNDARSGNRPHDISRTMLGAGFKLKHWTRGFDQEWIGYYTRA